MELDNPKYNLMDWKFKVKEKNHLVLPDDYQYKRASGTYESFTSFVEEFAERLLKGTGTGFTYMGEEEHSFGELDFDSASLPKDWWSIAKMVADGKKPKESIPQIPYSDKQNNLTVYNALLPAYRAIRESFENRSVFQWITNHAEYTAERDAMKALEGLMISLTGDSKAKLEEAYSEYKDEVKLETEVREEDGPDNESINDEGDVEELDNDDELYNDDDLERTSITIEISDEKPKPLSEIMDEVRKDQIKKQLGI